MTFLKLRSWVRSSVISRQTKWRGRRGRPQSGKCMHRVGTSGWTYCFRIRCTLGATVHIASDDSEWVLATQDSDGEAVVLASADGDGRPLSRARDVVVRGSFYDSEGDARAAGERWLPRVRVAFARTGVGADFGERGGPGGWWYEAGLQMLEDEHGGRMLNDAAGLSVFECEPAPRFARIGPATVTAGRSGTDVLGALRQPSPAT